MRIKLDEKHYLISDSQCYWIAVEVNTEDGKKYDKRISGYTRTFAQAVDSLVESHIRCAEIDDLKKLAETIEELKQTVHGLDVRDIRKE